MEDNENEGLSTGKKVVAGAAIGVAVPAAVGVAKKLMGDGDDQEEGGGDGNRSRQKGRTSTRSTTSGRGRASATKKRAGTTAKSGSRRTTRARSSARSTGARARSSSSSTRRSSSSSGGGSGRTKEQLYNQAKRLGIEGRSSMTKAQLERAINRARS
ncbi:MAG TPA: hypothetical protein VE688_00810 [Gaiellaceae bacterium]|jgi:hypothetical protein|nr:hypothetical protein [Gaiellaceae bacterium]